KYCGIPTLERREDELESRPVALLRAAGLGVNSASFTDFEPGERICTDCAAHEVECDLCGRQMDSFLDGGVYRRANADEAYVCTRCAGRLDESLERDRGWEWPAKLNSSMSELEGPFLGTARPCLPFLPEISLPPFPPASRVGA